MRNCARNEGLYRRLDAFLRALQRDVAWDFFYGIVNFDGVFGPVNHYGTVDLFAGRFNEAYRRNEVDHTENFDTPVMVPVVPMALTKWVILPPVCAQISGPVVS